MQMTAALNFFGKVLKPTARGLFWAFLNKTNFVLRTGNRRFEFERLYLKNRDPWGYLTNAYEREKYQRTLSCLLNCSHKSGQVLEVGCSIGVFTKMLVSNFTEVTAVEISKEALSAAIDLNRGVSNVRFVFGDLLSVKLGAVYDVIICAEILYYIPQRDTDLACRQLALHLADKGVIVVVMGVSDFVSDNRNDPSYSNGWESILGAHFRCVFAENVLDARRPYRIGVYSLATGKS